MKVPLAIFFAALLASCGGGESPAPVSTAPLIFRLASPVSGDTETALHLYQALYGKAPSYTQLNTFKSQIAANGPVAWVNASAGSFSNLSNTAFASLVLNNISVTPTTLTATTSFGTPQQAYDSLLAGFADYLNFVGTGNRGVVAAQVAKIISGLEVDTQFGVYGGAAVALNKQIAANVGYSTNPANLTDSVVQPAAPTNTTTYNECIDPATSTLPTGFTSKLVFTYTGSLTGDQTVDTVIDGPGFTFEGQSAIQATNTTTGSNTTSVAGSSVTATTSTKIRTYQQIGTNGLTKTLGALIDVTITTSIPSFPGLPSLPSTITNNSSITVYNPADENIEYTLALGSSLNKTTSQTTTITSGAGANVPTATTGTLRHTFEAKESITLASGKSYNTCRYKTSNVDGSNPTTSWLIVGKGVPARSQSIANGQTQTIELKSGTYNGTAL